MNARQKAKKYKKRCEQLEKMVYLQNRNFLADKDKHSVVELRVEQLLDKKDFYNPSVTEDCEFSAFNKKMAAQFLHQIINYANIETIHNPYGYSDKILIQATMKVIDMNKLVDKFGDI